MSRFWKISLLVVAVLVVVFVAMRMMGGGQQGKRPGRRMAMAPKTAARCR